MPTDDPLAQYALELLNRARVDPGGAFGRLVPDPASGTGATDQVTAAIARRGIDLEALEDALSALAPAPPLAFDGRLALAAEGHNAAMIAADRQTHQAPGEPPLGDRVTATGYDWQRLAENVFGYADGVLDAHAAFLIDWDDGPGGVQDPPVHRLAIMNPAFAHVGLAVTRDDDPSTGLGPVVTTQNFAMPRTAAPALLGVVHDDRDGDGAYDPGEGVSGVAVSVAGTAGRAEGTTAGAGGYALAPGGTGEARLTFSSGPLAEPVSVSLSLDGANRKVDLRDGSTIATHGDVTLHEGAWHAVLVGDGGLSARGNGLANRIEGAGGNDRLIGRGGADSLDGGFGRDVLIGNGGDDGLVGGPGRARDVLRGGAGDDEAHGGGGGDRLVGNAGADRLTGNGGGDRLHGGGGADTTVGGAGRDRLDGGPGDDVLTGGGGRDRLAGGPGDDVLKGGGGADRFVFSSRSANDAIRDFRPGVDLLDLSATAATGPDDLAVRDTPAGLTIDHGDGTILLARLTAADVTSADALF